MFLGFFCNFLHISKAGQKKKKENVEQYWADSGPRPRWWLYRKALGVFTNWGWVLPLFNTVTDTLH
jgi:hypothetical protein